MERMQRIDAFHSAQQFEQFRLAPKQNLSGPVPQGLGEPDELDCIPQPVIAAYQHAPPFELLAPPDALEMTFARVLGRVRKAVFLKMPVTDLPGAIQFGFAHGVRPITVYG